MLSIFVGCLWLSTGFGFQQNDGFESLRATFGKLFVHELKPSDFFSTPRASATFSASAVGSPALPSWLHLLPSEETGADPNGRDDDAVSFLYGTPGSEQNVFDVEVIAKDARTYTIVRKVLRITVGANPSTAVAIYPTRQSCTLIIKSISARQLLSQPSYAHHLAKCVQTAFGPGAVIGRLRSVKLLAEGSKERAADVVDGTLLEAVTGAEFSQDAHNFARGVQRNPAACDRADNSPFDKHFAPYFKVDWCTFTLDSRTVRSVPASSSGTIGTGGVLSTLHGLEVFWHSRELVDTVDSYTHNFNLAAGQNGTSVVFSEHDPTKKLERNYFRDWILVVPVPAVILIVLILLLSLIFFGGREGQHWRDYKTPELYSPRSHQLHEYVSLRRCQNKLIGMTRQRQSFLGVAAADGIRAFLVPKSGSGKVPAFATAQDVPPSYATSVGKQTVGEAAAIRGAPLNAYLDPAAEEDEDELRQAEQHDVDGLERIGRDGGLGELESSTSTIIAPTELSARRARSATAATAGSENLANSNTAPSWLVLKGHAGELNRRDIDLV